MIKIDREDIHIINQNSNLSEAGIDRILKEHVYSSKGDWHKFLKLFLISLGVGFTAFGILFFFAYNWADLDKFIKIGLIEIMIIALAAAVLFSKLSEVNKNILLTGTALIVGVLFAVFGQIYQTGANAYDFFLGWSISITLWVLVANFAPLWLLYLTLINTTFILYNQQVGDSSSPVFLFAILFILNIVLLSMFLYGKRIIKQLDSPAWFTHLIALAIVVFGTIGVTIGILEKEGGSWFILLIVLMILMYGVGIQYGLKQHSTFYLSIIAFSLIVIFSVLLIRIIDERGVLFIVSLFVMSSVSLVVYQLINLQKKWKK